MLLKFKPSYPDEESDWAAYKEKELLHDRYEEEKEILNNESKD